MRFARRVAADDALHVYEFTGAINGPVGEKKTAPLPDVCEFLLPDVLLLTEDIDAKASELELRAVGIETHEMLIFTMRNEQALCRLVLFRHPHRAVRGGFHFQNLCS